MSNQQDDRHRQDAENTRFAKADGHFVEAFRDIHARQTDGEQSDVGQNINKAINECERRVDDIADVAPIDATGENQHETNREEGDARSGQGVETFAINNQYFCKIEATPQEDGPTEMTEDGAFALLRVVGAPCAGERCMESADEEAERLDVSTVFVVVQPWKEFHATRHDGGIDAEPVARQPTINENTQ